MKLMKTKKVLVDGKPVIYKSTRNTPPLQVIKEAYAKIPDNKSIPVVFETKTQYLNEYIKNQEKKKNIDFTPSQEKAYKHRELRDMSNIVSRYTTNHNPYIDRRVVFFTDKKMPVAQFKKSVLHEYGHELWETSPGIRKDWKAVNRSSSPTLYGKTDRQEDFAESFMLSRSGQLRDSKRANIINKTLPKTSSNVTSNMLKNNNDFSEFDVNGDGKINDYDMSILRKREKSKRLLKRDISKNSVADAINADVPNEYLFTEEWKLYGAPKHYDPRTHDSANLTFNISEITGNYYNKMRNSGNSIPPDLSMSNNAGSIAVNMLRSNNFKNNTDFKRIFGAKMTPIISTDIGVNREVEPRIEPYSENLGELPVYETNTIEQKTNPIFDSSKNVENTVFNTNISDLPTINTDFKNALGVVPASESENLKEIGVQDKYGGLDIYNEASTKENKFKIKPKPRTSLGKLGIYTTKTSRDNLKDIGVQDKYGGLDIYESSTPLNENLPNPTHNTTPTQPTPSIFSRFYNALKKKAPKSPPPEPVKRSALFGVPLWKNKLGDELIRRQEAKKQREKDAEAREKAVQQKNYAIQQLTGMSKRGLLPRDVNRALAATQFMSTSMGDMRNDFGVIRAGSTYSSEPVTQRHAFIFANPNEDPNLRRKLLGNQFYSSDYLTEGY